MSGRRSCTCHGLYNTEPQALEELRAMARAMKFVRAGEAMLAFTAMACFAAVVDKTLNIYDTVVDGSVAYYLLQDSLATLWYGVLLCLVVFFFALFTAVHLYYAADDRESLTDFRIGVLKNSWFVDFVLMFMLLGAFAASLASPIQSKSFANLVGDNDNEITGIVAAALSMVFFLFAITLGSLPVTFIMWKDQNLWYTGTGGPVTPGARL